MLMQRLTNTFNTVSALPVRQQIALGVSALAWGVFGIGLAITPLQPVMGGAMMAASFIGTPFTVYAGGSLGFSYVRNRIYGPTPPQA